MAIPANTSLLYHKPCALLDILLTKIFLEIAVPRSRIISASDLLDLNRVGGTSKGHSSCAGGGCC